MTTVTVYKGQNVTQSRTEQLQPVDLYDIYSEIRNEEILKEEIRRLRKVAMVDLQAYNRVKTRLPYFCCASFDGNIRKGEHFRSIKVFVIDIDKVPDEDQLNSLKEEISHDPRVKMLFVSPGGRGLKIVMELLESCQSLKQFSDFYKTFVYQFAEWYKLTGLVDLTTCDATRVTFISHDESASFNALNEPVALIKFLPQEIFTQPADTNSDQPIGSGDENKKDLEETVYREILQKLNPGAHIRKKTKQIFIPEILDKLEEPIRSETVRMGLTVKEIRDIHYGKKVILALGLRFGEVNLFYGKRGFSVVRSPKCGSDDKLSEITEMLIRKVLAEFRLPDSASMQEVPYALN
ncbi:MAG: hypothetical protein ISS19_09640 [Bacteroidales bacterium]|nr:hypothetical protein [Bacteroidales bacterium]